MIVLGAGMVLIPKLPLIRIMVFTQVVNGILLPFILVFMLRLINKEKLMGRYKNGPWFNGIAWGTTIIMIGLTLYLVVSGVQDLFA
jgi:Mn2+/Fe2+ NRAMP family transporter